MTRVDIASYVASLFDVYTILIFAYVLMSLVFSLGVSLPYSRVVDVIFKFLRDICEPYLRLFRRFIPPLGPLDLSPIVAIFVLWFGGSLIVNLIHG